MPKPTIDEFTVSGEFTGSSSSSGSGATGPAGEPGTAPDSSQPEHHAWRGPLPWATCAVVLVLLGMILTGPLRTEEGPWGQVADVTSPPQAAWAVEPDEGVISARMIDGVLVTAGEETVRGRDPGSGALLWEVAQKNARCTSDSTNLVCTDIASQVLQIDPHSGEKTELEVPRAIAVAESGGDLFAVTRTDGGQVQRLHDNQVLWSTPVTLGAGGYGAVQEPMAVIAGQVLTTLVMNGAGFGSAGAAFDAETGKQWPTEQPYIVHLSPGVWANLAAEGSALFIRGEDKPLEFPGYQPLQYDDQWRSGDMVTSADDGSLTVQDSGSGEVRWSSDETAYPLARVDGVLFAFFADEGSIDLRGLRASTGELLWQRDDSWLACPCLGDGSTLVATVNRVTEDGVVNSSSGTVVGLDAQTGNQLWDLETPAALVDLVTDGQTLILVSQGELTAWHLG